MDYSSCDIRYRYGHADSDNVSIRYRYVQNVAGLSLADVVYRWSRDSDTPRCPRQFGFWAASTQELGNRLPHWHMGHLNAGGNTQLLMNAWGMGLDDSRTAYARYRKNLYIGTADLSEPDVFYFAPTVDIRGLDRNRVKNLLKNPSFSVLGLARSKTPIHWSKREGETTGTVEPVSSPTQFGSHSIRVHTEDGERAYFNQRSSTTIPRGTPVTGSIWYMVPLAVNTLEADESTASLALFVLYADGSMDVVRSPFAVGTNGRWRRASCSITAEKVIASIDFAVSIWNDSGLPIRVYLSGAQLETMTNPTPWEDPIVLQVPYVRENQIPEPVFDAYADYGAEETTEELITGVPIIYDAVSRRKLIYLQSFDELWNGLAPSRATVEQVVGVPPATQRTTLGWLTTPDGNPPFTTAWRIANNKVEQYNQAISHEIFGSFDIAEYWLDDWYNELVGVMSEDEDSSFSRTLEALCIHQNLIWIVCKETVGLNTVRVLKVLNPKNLSVNPNAYDTGATPMYLECMGDVNLGITSGTVDYLGIIDSDSQKMLMRIGATYYQISFEWDYYVYEDFRGQVILRTPLTGGTLVTT